MEISSIPIAFCVILGILIICYIIITVLHVFILLNKIKQQITAIIRAIKQLANLITLSYTILMI